MCLKRLIDLSGLVALLVFMPEDALGQFPDLAEINGQYLPGSQMSVASPLEAQVSSYELGLNLPIELNKRNYLIPGLTYHTDSLSYKYQSDGFVPLRLFHSLDLSALYVHLYDNKWSFSGRASVGLAGDFKKIDADLLRFSAMGMATYSYSESLILGGGALVSYAYGELLPLPAIYVDWTPTKEIQLEAFLPAFAVAKYTFAKRVEVGLRAEVSGYQYSIDDRRLGQSDSCTAYVEDSSEGCTEHLAFSNGRVGAILGVRLVGSLWWTNFAGWSVFQRLEQYDHQNQKLAQASFDLPAQFVFRSGLTFRIPRD